MDVKLDENLGTRGGHILTAHGHNVKTVEILAEGMKKKDITGKLWIVQKSGIREYIPD